MAQPLVKVQVAVNRALERLEATEQAAFGPGDPPEPGMVWTPPHHLVGLGLGRGIDACTECGGSTWLTPPCKPGRWYHWSRPPLPLAEQSREDDGRGWE